MSGRNPKISVIMAAYNSVAFISETIESILQQCFRDFEFLIIDDCSTDQTVEIIEKYAHQDKRIRLIKNTVNLGQIKSRNLLLNQAQGDYIAITDHDDISLAERLKIQSDYLNSNPDIFLVGSAIVKIDETGKEINKVNVPIEPDKIARLLPRKNVFFHSTVMYRRVKGLYYRSKMHYVDDYDFLLQLLSQGKRLANINKVLLKIRTSASTQTLKYLGKQDLLAEQARKFYYQRINTGKDDYDIFDSEKILNIDVEESNDRTIIRGEIRAAFRLNNFSRTRKFCLKYFKHYGPVNNLWLYFFGSLLPKSIINLMRKYR